MPNTPSPDFWNELMEGSEDLWTEDKLVNDDLELVYGDMSTSDLCDTYQLLSEEDMPIPLDLQVELNTRGLICRSQ